LGKDFVLNQNLQIPSRNPCLVTLNVLCVLTLERAQEAAEKREKVIRELRRRNEDLAGRLREDGGEGGGVHREKSVDDELEEQEVFRSLMVSIVPKS
jgi:hypothetical protein